MSELADDLSPLAALERFVVDNDDLLVLESTIGRFNIFDALRIARTEIRHSNFLAFILDPGESHGQSQLFLRAVLMDLLKAAPPSLRPFSPIEIDGSDLQGVVVRREWKNIDLLITGEDPRFILAIENKIASGEHSDQLARYKTVIRTHYPDARPLYVLLSPDGREASEEEWIGYSYGDLHRVLSRVRAAHFGSIGDDVRVFLDHYLTLIGTRLMDDPKIDELCQRIYKNHRQALQLIFDRVGGPGTGILAEVESVLRNDDRWHVFYRNARLIDFVPKSWMGWLPPLGLDSREHPQSWFVFRFEALIEQLDFLVEIRRMQNAAQRLAIIRELFAEGANYGFVRKTSREPRGNYTRVSSRERVLHWGKEGEPDLAELRQRTKQKLDALFSKLTGLDEVVRRALRGNPDQ